MKCKLSDLSNFIMESASFDEASVENYVSTESMIADRGGITEPSALPKSGSIRRYRPGDVLISNIRPYFKKIWRATRTGTCSNDVLVIRSNGSCNPAYLYYVLSSDDFFNYMTATSKGTKMPRGDKEAIMDYEIDLPSLEQQEQFTSTMSKIDDLIWTNSKINDYLSNIAEAVFTHFQITHKTSECHLSDIAYIVMGQSPPGESYNTEGRGIMFFQGRAEFGQFFPTPNLFTDQPKRLASKGDILISVRAPVGDINIAIADCCIGRGLAAVRSNSGCQAYIHHLIDSIRSNFDQYNGTGTVFGSINKNELNSLTMHIVDSETMKECNSILSEIDAAIKHMHDENELLIKIRMLLMSKFLSST